MKKTNVFISIGYMILKNNTENDAIEINKKHKNAKKKKTKQKDKFHKIMKRKP